MILRRFRMDRLLYGFSLLLLAMAVFHVYVILDMEIHEVESYEFKKTITIEDQGELDGGVFINLMTYVDSVEFQIQSGEKLYFFELPYTLNLGISERDYPGMKHCYRFLAIWKENGDAEYLSKSEEGTIVSSPDISVSAKGLRNSNSSFYKDEKFFYQCPYFKIRLEFKQLNFIEKTRWFFASEYNLFL